MERLRETISVPSKEALFLRIKPTPKPRRIPPKTVTRSKSSVTCPNLETTLVAIESIEIAKNVLITNLRPKVLYASKINGILIPRINRPKFPLVIYAAIIEIPITPPSIILFGSKNISRATATIKAPIIRKTAFLIYSIAISFFVLTLTAGFFF